MQSSELFIVSLDIFAELIIFFFTTAILNFSHKKWWLLIITNKTDGITNSYEVKMAATTTSKQHTNTFSLLNSSRQLVMYRYVSKENGNKI